MTGRLSTIKSHLSPIPNDDSLEQYRSRGPQFSIEEFRNIYSAYGLELYNSYLAGFKSIPNLDHSNLDRRTPPEQRRELIRIIKELAPHLQLGRQLNKHNPLKSIIIGKVLFGFEQQLAIRLGVHGTLYTDSLLALGTEKHFASIDRAYSVQDIGCFALTELAHGSNVGGIQTRADFIPETREFVLNTPTPLDAKWWIGAAAQTANKSAVFAQLYMNGVHKGVNVFLIDIRDYETHEALPGVIFGDCGPKVGQDGIDNGFILFQNYKVPYDSLLDKFTWISLEGKFKSTIKNKDKRLAVILGSLSRGRISIVSASENALRNAMTIAIRFSAVRKQFGVPEKPESSILDYPLTRFRLIPHLANLFAINKGFDLLLEKYSKTHRTISDNPESPENSELHAILSSFKSLSSFWAFDGLQAARTICGGMGYSSFARLGIMRDQCDVNITWEGDNNVLLQQTVGFILKEVQKTFKGQPVRFESLKVLNLDHLSVLKQRYEDPINVDSLLTCLAQTVNILLHKTMLKLQENATSSEHMIQAWNSTQPLYAQDLGKAFGVYLLADHFYSWCKTIPNIEIKQINLKLLELFMVDKVLAQVPDLVESEYVSPKFISPLKDHYINLCNELGESAVRVIDAIANPDFMHESVLGHSDGQMYKRFTEKVESCPDCYNSKPEWLPLLKDLRGNRSEKL